jgi:uncharacterized protein YkwD
LHKAAIALLAAPIIFVVYLGAILRRSTLARASLAIGLALVLGIGVIGAGRPATTVATPPTAIVPLTQTAFTTSISTARGVGEPVTIGFSAPMDPASVEAVIKVEPPTPVNLAWDETGTELTVSPRERWSVGEFHTVTVPAGALAASGQPLTRPARAVFLTRDATSADAVATDPIGDRVSVLTTFRVSFARSVDPATVATGIRLDPPTPGIVQSGSPTDAPGRYTFVPSAPLRPDTEYQLVVSGVRDMDGVPIDTVSLAVRTTKSPGVVRFRPKAGTGDVARDAPVSVRFTEPMDRRSTARAFTVSIGGKAIAGSVRWAERDTVLVFTPAARLPSGTTVTMEVRTGAKNTAKVPMAAPVRGTFKTVTSPKALAPGSTTRTSTAITGGSGVGGGSWAAVETYYLGLMNCTRTGGWVTSTGRCSSPGGRNVAPLKLSSGISSKVSRPYAKRLAVGNDCSHFIGGNPGDRLRRAGYTSYRWAENIGCRSGAARAAVLASHLFFQSEKSYNGGHYRNLMNAAYDRVGIGVWVSGGRVRLVIDFYHP